MEKVNIENIQDRSIVEELKESFIDYAMSVIVSRAIPDTIDGLKPVHRRIIYAMSNLDMVYNKPTKKSARVVGEVLAKYHPHGDAAAYESMVRLAQPFSLRYPLIQGQGNFGSVDGDSAAAMRYTEVRLSKISNLLIRDLKKNTVNFVPNYDGTEKEPSVLPSLIPNLLLNGSTGIAVGMTTSIPPHNLNEVMNAAMKIASNPNITIDELMEDVQGPDFPLGGIIVNPIEMRKGYFTGHGRAIVRSTVEIKFNEEKNYGELIITDIPYMVNKSNLIKKMVDIVKNKAITSISNISDQSNRKGIRLVLKLKRGFIPEVELKKLYKMTPLQSSFPINLLALSNGAPDTFNLKQLLEIYIDSLINILIKKTIFEYEKAKARKHIVDGLQIALNNIDEIIGYIKSSNTTQEVIEILSSKFSLTEIQVRSILDMKLNRLTGLERRNLTDELIKLEEMIKKHELILSSKEEQTKIIIELMESIKNEFGDERRTKVLDKDIHKITNEDLVPDEEVIITISKKGYIKRIAVDEYKVQRKGGKGSKGITVNDEDFVSEIIHTNTHSDLLCFTTQGNVYRLKVYEIPSLGKNAKGLPIINLISLNEGEIYKSTLAIGDNYADIEILFVTEKGLVKRVGGAEFKNVSQNGKIAIQLKGDDQLFAAKVIEEGTTAIIIGSSNSKAVKFNLEDLKLSKRYSQGSKGININKEVDKVVGFGFEKQDKKVFALSENGFGKLTNVEEFRLTKRGVKGVAALNSKTAGNLINLDVVYGNEDLMIVTNDGIVIRVSLETINDISRRTKGSKIIKLNEGQTIVSSAFTPHETEATDD